MSFSVPSSTAWTSFALALAKEGRRHDPSSNITNPSQSTTPSRVTDTNPHTPTLRPCLNPRLTLPLMRPHMPATILPRLINNNSFALDTDRTTANSSIDLPLPNPRIAHIDRPGTSTHVLAAQALERFAAVLVSAVHFDSSLTAGGVRVQRA
jgi:hypothetical protein